MKCHMKGWAFAAAVALVVLAAVDDAHSALSMAKLLSRQDPRDVVVVENRIMGDTVMVATFRRGVREADPFEIEGEAAVAEPLPAQGSGGADGTRDRV